MTRTRGAWSAAQTRLVILDAACASLCAVALEGDGHVRLDVTDVLNRANDLWDRRYGSSAGAKRVMTRGAITSQWRTSDELEERALLCWFDQGLVPIPKVWDLALNVVNISSVDDLRERRRGLRRLFADFVTTAILGGNDDVQWTLRYLVLRNRHIPKFQSLLQDGDAARRKALFPIYDVAVGIAGWKIDPAHLVDMHLSIIDGALLQLSWNKTKRDVNVALLAGASADLICKGLRRSAPNPGTHGVDQLKATYTPADV